MCRRAAGHRRKRQSRSHGVLVNLDQTSGAHNNTNHHDSHTHTEQITDRHAQAQIHIDSYTNHGQINPITDTHVSPQQPVTFLTTSFCQACSQMCVSERMSVCVHKVNEEVTGGCDDGWSGRCLQSALSPCRCL